MRGNRALVVIALAAAAMSCAAPSGPVAIPTDELPFPLARTVESKEPEQGRTLFTVYLVRRGRLHPVGRRIATGLPRPEAVMRALLEGETPRERRRGLTSEIPRATRLLQLTVTDRIAEVDLGDEFEHAASSDSFLLRIAQVVWTLVRLPEVTAVRFSIDGAPISVVTDRGRAVERPVSSPDYARVGPRRPPPSAPARSPATPSPGATS